MNEPILVTAALLIFPLIPATVIYYILTPKKSDSQNNAKGSYEGKLLEFGKVSIEFNVFGSTATYIVLLFAAYFIHSDISKTERMKLSIEKDIRHEDNEKSRLKSALSTNQAWSVDIPVMLQDEDGIPINNSQLSQVSMVLVPDSTEVHLSKLKFWVRVKEDGSFPQVQFSYPGMREANNLDLNDSLRINYDHATRKMKGIEPVWIKIGKAYNKEGSYLNEE